MSARTLTACQLAGLRALAAGPLDRAGRRRTGLTVAEIGGLTRHRLARWNWRIDGARTLELVLEITPAGSALLAAAAAIPTERSLP